MKVAAIQMVSGASVQANLDAAAQLLRNAADQGAELAVCPSISASWANRDTDKLAIAETPGEGQVQRFLAATARALGLWLAGGTLPLASADPSACATRTWCIRRKANVWRATTRSTCSASTMAMSGLTNPRAIEAGREPALFTLPSRDGHTWRVGLSVCYDLRFPELYRALAADLLLVPSAFTWVTGRRIGRFCCVRAPSKTWLLWLHRTRRCARERPSYLGPPWWWIPGALCWRNATRGRRRAGRSGAARLAHPAQQLPALTHRVL
jgi:predicted amidohydrolase